MPKVIDPRFLRHPEQQEDVRAAAETREEHIQDKDWDQGERAIQAITCSGNEQIHEVLGEELAKSCII